MPATTSNSPIRITRLILVPAVISLVITILRLVGELRHWPGPWFNATAGGGGAIIGISWLPFIFGPYFALKLSGRGDGPTGSGKAIGFAVLGLFLLFASSWVAFAPQAKFPGQRLLGLLILVVAAALPFRPWPTLAKTLTAYGYVARIPVAVVMYFAIRGSWGTHYDALPPEYSGPTSFWGKYLMMGLIPQLIFWVGFTILIGSLFGTIVTAIAHRGRRAAQPA